MSAEDLLQYLTWGLLVVVFVVTCAEAIRHPRRSTVDPALLFGVLTAIIAESVLAGALAVVRSELWTDLISSLLMALPYLLLRLVEDFSHVPRRLRYASEIGLAASIVCLFAVEQRPSWLNLLLVVYFVTFTLYTIVAFVMQAAQSGGVTRRRLAAVAFGSGFLVLDSLAAGLALTAPGLARVWTSIAAACGLGVGVGYFLGFAPPGWLRRSWQAPELRMFLARAASLPRLPDTQAIVRELEDGAAMSLGAEWARIGLWDEGRKVLLYHRRHITPEFADHLEDGDVAAFSPDEILAGEALSGGGALFVAEPAEADRFASGFRDAGMRNLLIAPIAAGDQRLGVISAHAATTIFAEEDLELLRLLATQAAVILETRRLIDEATRLQAREEATRLKDDFLSAAAHDLKSPLTSIFGQAQRLQRQARRDLAQVDPHGLDVIVQQTDRLRGLVSELLDAGRVERRALSGIRDTGDLVEVLREVCSREYDAAHRCHLEAPEPLVGSFDMGRMRQLFDNLIENAVKYSPAGGDILVRAWHADCVANITVSDPGIGINPAEVPRIFDRFHRGANVDDRHFPGMGLGLYICRGIVEEHGGRIWAESAPGQGTTMHVTIPIVEGHQA